MISLYIHIPFCARKCDYCSFYSVTDNCKEQYVDALERALAYHGKKQKTATVYIGGGTPSLISPALLERVFSAVYDNFDIDKSAEITIEANPESFSRDFALTAKNFGVNRLSLGVQSFDDKELASVGRLHDSKGAKDALSLACDMFENISCDLIFGLPYQTEKSFESSLDTACKSGVNHISCYNLQVEHGTPIYQKQIAVPDEEIQEKLYFLACEKLEQNGYEHYEISNYAKKGFESRHNSSYWTGADYIGIGPSAHSKLGNMRFYYDADICKFISKKDFEFDGGERITDPLFEKIMLGLRTSRGIPADILKKSAAYVARLEKSGFAVVKNGRVILTDKGFYLSNTIISDITAKEL